MNGRVSAWRRLRVGGGAGVPAVGIGRKGRRKSPATREPVRAAHHAGKENGHEVASEETG